MIEARFERLPRLRGEFVEIAELAEALIEVLQIQVSELSFGAEGFRGGRVGERDVDMVFKPELGRQARAARRN